MNGLALVAACSLVLSASPVFAQAPAAPAPAPAAQAPAAAAPAQAAPAAPKPFPAGAKVAYVVLQRIANESADGRVATTRIQALQQKKAAELNEKNKQIQGLQQKLEKEGSVMSVAAQADLQKQVEKLNVDVQRFTQDAQAEVQELQQELQADFQKKLLPVINTVAADMGLLMVFSQVDSGLVWADPGLDVTAEVIKRFDSAATPAAKPQGQ